MGDKVSGIWYLTFKGKSKQLTGEGNIELGYVWVLLLGVES